MGERLQATLFQPSFNRGVVVTLANADLSGDAGALIVREAAGQVGVLGALATLADPRNQALVEYPMADLVLSRLLLLAQGWTDQDDIDALRADPALRAAVNTGRSASVIDRPLPSQPTLSRAMATLGTAGNREQLRVALLDVGLRRVRQDRGRSERLVIDLDSFPIETHGNQEGSAYNGHYHESCFHPIVAIADTGDILGIDLRAGNVHTASEATTFLEPIVEAASRQHERVWVRFDAGFAAGPFFDWLDARSLRFVTRLKANAALHREVAAWRTKLAERWAVTRRDGQEPREATYEFWYKADKWTRTRRVVAVLVERSDLDGTLFDQVFFLCSNVARREGSSRELLEFYRHRGSCEARIGEFVTEIVPNLSSPSRAVNEATLRLAGLAYQVAHHLRRKLEKFRREGLSLRRLRERALKAPALLVRHARRAVLRVGLAFAETWRELATVLREPVDLQTEVQA